MARLPKQTSLGAALGGDGLENPIGSSREALMRSTWNSGESRTSVTQTLGLARDASKVEPIDQSRGCSTWNTLDPSAAGVQPLGFSSRASKLRSGRPKPRDVPRETPPTRAPRIYRCLAYRPNIKICEPTWEHHRMFHVERLRLLGNEGSSARISQPSLQDLGPSDPPA